MPANPIGYPSTIAKSLPESSTINSCEIALKACSISICFLVRCVRIFNINTLAVRNIAMRIGFMRRVIGG